jgi:hypothetical protein
MSKCWLFANFVMDSENAGLLSDFGKSATGIIGSENLPESPTRLRS